MKLDMKAFVDRVTTELRREHRPESLTIPLDEAVAIARYLKSRMKNHSRGGKNARKNVVVSDDPIKAARAEYMRNYRAGIRRRPVRLK